MADRVAKVVADVFGVPMDSVNDSRGPTDIEQWDSLGHITLVLALESEFQVRLSPDDATEMLSVASIKAVLAKCGVTNLA